MGEVKCRILPACAYRELTGRRHAGIDRSAVRYMKPLTIYAKVQKATISMLSLLAFLLLRLSSNQQMHRAKDTFLASVPARVDTHGHSLKSMHSRRMTAAQQIEELEETPVEIVSLLGEHEAVKVVGPGHAAVILAIEGGPRGLSVTILESSMSE